MLSQYKNDSVSSTDNAKVRHEMMMDSHNSDTSFLPPIQKEQVGNSSSDSPAPPLTKIKMPRQKAGNFQQNASNRGGYASINNDSSQESTIDNTLSSAALLKSSNMSNQKMKKVALLTSASAQQQQSAVRNNSQKTRKSKAFGLVDGASKKMDLNNSSVGPSLDDKKAALSDGASMSAANDQTQALISQSLIKMLQKKCTEMAKLADREVMARSCVEKQMEVTQQEKDELEQDNRCLAQ